MESKNTVLIHSVKYKITDTYAIHLKIILKGLKIHTNIAFMKYN